MVYDKEGAHLPRTQWEGVFQLQTLAEEFGFTSLYFSIAVGLSFISFSGTLALSYFSNSL